MAQRDRTHAPAPARGGRRAKHPGRHRHRREPDRGQYHRRRLRTGHGQQCLCRQILHLQIRSLRCQQPRESCGSQFLWQRQPAHRQQHGGSLQRQQLAGQWFSQSRCGIHRPSQRGARRAKPQLDQHGNFGQPSHRGRPQAGLCDQPRRIHQRDGLEQQCECRRAATAGAVLSWHLSGARRRATQRRPHHPRRAGTSQTRARRAEHKS